MKKLYLVCLFCCLSFFAFSNQISKKDIEFLKDKGVFSGSDLFGKFSQTKSMKGGSKQFSSFGEVYISPENGIGWFTEKPYESLLVVTSDHLTQQIRKNKPTRLSSGGNEVYRQIANSLQSVFFGNFDDMLKNFETDFFQDDGYWTITLLPKNENLKSFINKIQINGSETIRSLLLVEASGDSILYGFENLVNRRSTDEERKIWNL